MVFGLSECSKNVVEWLYLSVSYDLSIMDFSDYIILDHTFNSFNDAR